jgi:hypothetical protein
VSIEHSGAAKRREMKQRLEEAKAVGDGIEKGDENGRRSSSLAKDLKIAAKGKGSD